MGSNKTSLLLVMTILMLRKSVKLDVIGTGHLQRVDFAEHCAMQLPS